MAHKHRILIVEDNPGTMSLLRQIVLRAGYEPLLARGGQEALQVLQTDSADLMLLDIMMKGVDGWAVLRAIKADSRLSNLPVIIVSAVDPSEYPPKIEAHSGLYEDYIVKPFDIETLVTRIAQVLRGSGEPG